MIFASFSNDLLTPFINKLDSSRDLTIFMTNFFIHYFHFFVWDYQYSQYPWVFLWIAATISDAAAINPNVMETSLANDVTTFFIKGKPTFINESRTLPKNPHFLVISFNKIPLFLKT